MPGNISGNVKYLEINCKVNTPYSIRGKVLMGTCMYTDLISIWYPR